MELTNKFMPSNKHRAIAMLKSHGFVFDETPNETGKLPKMLPVVTFPAGWGLWVDDEADDEVIMIINSEGKPVAQCGDYVIDIIPASKVQLDLSLYTLNANGYYELVVSNQDIYVEMIGEYNRCISFPQKYLDAHYARIKQFETDYIPVANRIDIPKHVSTHNPKRPSPAYYMFCAEHGMCESEGLTWDIVHTAPHSAWKDV